MLQLVSVVLLILPATASYGALFLLAMMVFSVYVHGVRDYQPSQIPIPLAIGALTAITAYLYGSVAFWPLGEIFRAGLG